MSENEQRPAGLASEDAYALVAATVDEIQAPVVAYEPPMPVDRSIPIGLIGAGGISFAHLDAYRKYGLNVVAICDRNIERAEARRDQFYPTARVFTDPQDLLDDSTIRVLDLAVHASSREALIRCGIDAGKHILSQKPFVANLDVGRNLVELAETKGVILAVNQNGRWAPYMSYMREVVRAGLIGDIIGVHAALQWDHSWIAGTPFEAMDQIILEDFAIHWFDFVASIIGDTATSVYATGTATSGQEIESKLAAQAAITFPGGQASLVFDGASRYGAQNITTIVGTKGTVRSVGADLAEQAVHLFVDSGVGSPSLEGSWFNDGFAGAMGSLLLSIENGSVPLNSARQNLASLKLVFAAIESSNSGQAVHF
ncbi:dehydrogenase [Rhizobium sp. AC44/96]|uniref:Gfo/Idh/MocA family protein n=1 Tax=Rhizobium sp. AC44/96 TaxID=1841654 RepID=UPI0008100DDC|nr:Gfo/Idh/MocA family oxidoreductase [Rhizobium sp. AC44/96]OCJ14420.1 dehydrogenase [Rhizobium sp. AC44/96]